MNSLLLIGAFFLSAAGGADRGMPANVKSLVDTERAFAKMSQTVSMRDAFLMYLAETGLVFNPGPVNGRELYQGRPASDVLLAWEPVYAEVSASGDFGFTTGPWDFSKDRTSDPIVSGHFVSVWKKQADGAWKVMVDIGIHHERSHQREKPALAFRASDDPDPWPLDGRALAAAREALIAADLVFARDFAHGAAGAFRAHGADDVRRYRSGAPPVAGKDAVLKVAEADAGGSPMKVAGADLASSGDLGYITGSRGEPVAAYYLRIWRLDEKRRWRVVLDIESPLEAGN